MKKIVSKPMKIRKKNDNSNNTNNSNQNTDKNKKNNNTNDNSSNSNMNGDDKENENEKEKLVIPVSVWVDLFLFIFFVCLFLCLFCFVLFRECTRVVFATQKRFWNFFIFSFVFCQNAKNVLLDFTPTNKETMKKFQKKTEFGDLYNDARCKDL